MKNLTELHTEHSELTSEVQFLKKEIEFLLKILRKDDRAKAFYQINKEVKVLKQSFMNI